MWDWGGKVIQSNDFLSFLSILWHGIGRGTDSWTDKAQIIEEGWTDFPSFKYFPYFVPVGGTLIIWMIHFVCGKGNVFVVQNCIRFFYSEDLEKDVEFEVVGDTPEKVGPKPSEPTSKNITNGSDDGAQPSTSTGK